MQRHYQPFSRLRPQSLRIKTCHHALHLQWHRPQTASASCRSSCGGTCTWGTPPPPVHTTTGSEHTDVSGNAVNTDAPQEHLSASGGQWRRPYSRVLLLAVLLALEFLQPLRLGSRLAGRDDGKTPKVKDNKWYPCELRQQHGTCAATRATRQEHKHDGGSAPIAPLVGTPRQHRFRTRTATHTTTIIMMPRAPVAVNTGKGQRPRERPWIDNKTWHKEAHAVSVSTVAYPGSCTCSHSRRSGCCWCQAGPAAYRSCHRTVRCQRTSR